VQNWSAAKQWYRDDPSFDLAQQLVNVLIKFVPLTFTSYYAGHPPGCVFVVKGQAVFS
jgi:hypothetical protein